MSDTARKRYLLVCGAGCAMVLLAGVVLVRLIFGSLSIEGDAAAPVTAGISVPLDLAITNRSDFRVAVKDLTVAVRSVHAPNADRAHPCTVGDFLVRQVSGDLEIVVGARTSSTLSELHLPRTTWPRIGMLNRSGCAGAMLDLDFTASRNLKIL